ncbi:MAG TPA: PLP-dependent aspartate aminotransferase family protein [Pelomicrobium sp.]|nr:PLP-dependent aspartate aminotransferase family protein [Pelomicrobium sp.]
MDPVTRIVHAGQEADAAYRSVTLPIYQTSTFRFADVGVNAGFEYSRIGNPTRAALERLLAELEGGAGAVAAASGMAAISIALSVLEGGAHVLCTRDCYGGTYRLLAHLQRQHKLETSFVDVGDAAARAAALTPRTRAVWVETPSNPLLRVTDLAELAAFARDHDLLLIADNTFLSPLLQRPLDFGADLIVHSTTKYLNGHADVVGGAVVARTEELARQIQFAVKTGGAVQAPFDAWLTLRGMKTLALRLAQHQANAQAVAEFLDAHPKVERVHYPGLPEDPGHALAKTQQRGFGGMVTFAVRGGLEAAHEVMRRVRLFVLAESLGGVESLIGHPATMSHAAMPAEYRREAGIADHLLRLSVGIEAVEDLLDDLAQALG